MSSPQYAAVPAGFVRRNVGLVAALSTRAAILVDQLAAAAAAATTPLFYGGGTIIEMTASNEQTSATALKLWNCRVGTVVGGSTGTVSTAATSINRAAGSFITDGFKVGQPVMIFAPDSEATNAGVDGIVVQVTAVAALALTVSGTALAVLASLATGTRICKASQKHVTNVPGSAGNNILIDSVNLLNAAVGDGYTDRTEWKLGPDDILAVSPVTAVTGSSIISVEAAVARY